MNSNTGKHKILLGLTTTRGSDWREMVRDIDRLGIKELALFPTCLSLAKKRELFKMLEATGLEEIPHVHLRDDMVEEKLDYLTSRWHTKVFNTHHDRRYDHFLKMPKYRDKIFIENLYKIDAPYIETVKKFGGICIDFSHWEDQGTIQGNFGYDKFTDLMKDYRVGCGHISSVRKESRIYRDPMTGKERPANSCHTFKEISEFEYIKKYLDYLPPIISIELENSFSEQLKVKKYLNNIISSNR